MTNPAQQNGHPPPQEEAEMPQIAVDVDGIMQTVHNLANIYLKTGNHEVRTAVQEIARGFCFIVGLEHQVFFPPAPPIRDQPMGGGITVPSAPVGHSWPPAYQATGRPGPMPLTIRPPTYPMPVPGAPGIQIPGMPPSPYAGYPAANPQNTDAWAPDPGNPTGAKMVVVDPGPGARAPGYGMPPGYPPQQAQGYPCYDPGSQQVVMLAYVPQGYVLDPQAQVYVPGQVAPQAAPGGNPWRRPASGMAPVQPQPPTAPAQGDLLPPGDPQAPQPPQG